jgi:hypothetical protein
MLDARRTPDAEGWEALSSRLAPVGVDPGPWRQAWPSLVVEQRLLLVLLAEASLAVARIDKGLRRLASTEASRPATVAGLAADRATAQEALAGLGDHLARLLQVGRDASRLIHV